MLKNSLFQLSLSASAHLSSLLFSPLSPQSHLGSQQGTPMSGTNHIGNQRTRSLLFRCHTKLAPPQQTF